MINRPSDKKYPIIGKWSFSQSETHVSFDTGRPGMAGLWTFLWVWQIVAGVLFLILQMLAGLCFSLLKIDFPMGLMVIPCLLIAEAPVVWALLRGFCWRERLQISGKNAWLRKGYPWKSSVSEFQPDMKNKPYVDLQKPLTGLLSAPLREVAKTNSVKNPFLFGRRIKIISQDYSHEFGAGLNNESLEKLSKLIEQHIKEQNSKHENIDTKEWVFPLYPSIKSLLFRVKDATFQSSKNLYSAFDIAIILIELLMIFLAESLDFKSISLIYPIAFAVHIASIIFRRNELKYRTGLNHYGEKIALFGTIYAGIGLVLGLYSGLLALNHFEQENQTLAFTLGGTLPLLGIIVYIWVYRSARKNKETPAKEGGTPGKIFLMLPLLALAIFHDNAASSLLQEQADNGGHGFYAFAIFAMMPLTLALYIPLRIHYFITAPGEQGNRIWFCVAVISMLLGNLI